MLLGTGDTGRSQAVTEKDQEGTHGLQFVPRTIPWTPCDSHQLLRDDIGVVLTAELFQASLVA